MMRGNRGALCQAMSTIDPRTRVGHVHLTVSDLDRALTFYRDVLGFEVTSRYGRDAVFLSAGGYHHHIGLNTWAGRGAPSPAQGTTGLYHFAILYPDRKTLAEAVRRVLDAGVADRESTARCAGMGSVTVTVVPVPTVDSTATLPANMLRTTLCTTTSPMPLPSPNAFVVKPGSKIRSRSWGRMPAPSSRTLNRRALPTCVRPTRIGAGRAALASAALRIRLTSRS